MKSAIPSVLITILVLIFFTTTTVAAAPGNSSIRELKIVKQGSAVAYPCFVRTKMDEYGLLIKGELKKRTAGRKRMLGHIDIVLEDKYGNQLSKRSVEFTPSRWSKESAITMVCFQDRESANRGHIGAGGKPSGKCWS